MVQHKLFDATISLEQTINGLALNLVVNHYTSACMEERMPVSLRSGLGEWRRGQPRFFGLPEFCRGSGLWSSHLTVLPSQNLRPPTPTTTERELPSIQSAKTQSAQASTLPFLLIPPPERARLVRPLPHPLAENHSSGGAASESIAALETHERTRTRAPLSP